MLIIALIVLVAMTLAGIATMRSVDTATVLAGNIAFRQSALNAADQVYRRASHWSAHPHQPRGGHDQDGMKLGLAGITRALHRPSPTGRTRTPGQTRITRR